MFIYLYTNVNFVQEFGSLRATVNALAPPTPELAEYCICFGVFINLVKQISSWVFFFCGSQYQKNLTILIICLNEYNCFDFPANFSPLWSNFFYIKYRCAFFFLILKDCPGRDSVMISNKTLGRRLDLNIDGNTEFKLIC